MPADYVIKQGDTLPLLTDTLTYADGSAVDLSGGGSVTLQVRSLTSAAVLPITGTVTVTNTNPLAVRYAPTAADTATPGNYQAEWVVTFQGVGQMSFPTVGYMWFAVEPALALASQQLVTLDDLKLYLNITSTSRERDAKLMQFIEGVTPVIEQITGPIMPKIYEEWFDGGSNLYQVARPPAIGYGTSPIFDIIAASEYRGPIEYPLSLIASPVFGSIYSTMAVTQYGTLTRRSAGGRTLAFFQGRDQVHVWYRSGQAQTPPNVREATLEMLRINYENSQQVGAARRTPVDEIETGPPIGFFVPRKVREMLAPTRHAPSFA